MIEDVPELPFLALFEDFLDAHGDCVTKGGPLLAFGRLTCKGGLSPLFRRCRRISSISRLADFRASYLPGRRLASGCPTFAKVSATGAATLADSLKK